ncbi:MAG: alpha/beta hydrolase, partial [Ilumatobacter sp.]
HSSPEPHDDADDLLAVMSATATDTAVVIGNSRGGGIAIDLALTSPERVAALVLIAPSLSGYDQSDWPTAAAEDEQDMLLIAAEKAEDLELLNRLETRYWLDGVEQPEGRVSGEPRELFLDMNERALHAAPIGDSSQRTPAWPMLSHIDVPVLVVAGEFDLPGIRKQCSETAAAIPLSEHVEIPGSAHCPSLDQPGLLSETVLTFLSRLPR